MEVEQPLIDATEHKPDLGCKPDSDSNLEPKLTEAQVPNEWLFFSEIRTLSVWQDVELKNSPNTSKSCPIFLKNRPTRALFHLFSSFQTHITNFTTNKYVKKCPPNIQCRDSNSQLLEHESPSITTRPRPRLPPLKNTFFMNYFFRRLLMQQKKKKKAKKVPRQQFLKFWKMIKRRQKSQNVLQNQI